jgi:hypothetical protein
VAAFVGLVWNGPVTPFPFRSVPTLFHRVRSRSVPFRSIVSFPTEKIKLNAGFRQKSLRQTSKSVKVCNKNAEIAQRRPFRCDNDFLSRRSQRECTQFSCCAIKEHSQRGGESQSQQNLIFVSFSLVKGHLSQQEGEPVLNYVQQLSDYQAIVKNHSNILKNL